MYYWLKIAEQDFIASGHMITSAEVAELAFAILEISVNKIMGIYCLDASISGLAYFYCDVAY